MREVVLEAGGLLHGSAAPALEAFLHRQAGVHHAAANPVGGTVTVGYDERAVSEAGLRRAIEACGLRCRGEVVPKHVCGPEEPALPAAGAAAGEMARMAHEMGHRTGMSMDDMVGDMRKRFFVTFVLALGVTLYAPLASQVFGLRLRAPFGLSNELLMFLLATPAVVWGGKMFYVGAWRALQHRTLDMSVLVALSVGAGYVFSVASERSSDSIPSLPRSCPETRRPGSRSSRIGGSWWRWSGTASTTHPRWPRPTWASPSGPAPTSPWKPRTLC